MFLRVRYFSNLYEEEFIRSLIKSNSGHFSLKKSSFIRSKNLKIKLENIFPDILYGCET